MAKITEKKLLRYIEDYAKNLREQAKESGKEGWYASALEDDSIARFLEGDFKYGVQHDLFN